MDTILVPGLGDIPAVEMSLKPLNRTQAGETFSQNAKRRGSIPEEEEEITKSWDIVKSLLPDIPLVFHGIESVSILLERGRGSFTSRYTEGKCTSQDDRDTWKKALEAFNADSVNTGRIISLGLLHAAEENKDL
jgi:hypothetical protein